MKHLGVIGGLGPMATAYFLELVVKMTDVKTDQEHLPVTVLNRPAIPDRTAYILGKSEESPLSAIAQYAKELQNFGASCIAIPCITSHYFYDEFSRSVDIPIINIVAETAAYLKAHGIQKAGIMATTGTISTNLFQAALNQKSIGWVIPSDEGQQKVMHLIYGNVKAGLPVETELFREVSEELREMGSECVILGCTELSLIKRDYPIGSGYLDALEVLAMCSVTQCKKPLKPQYQNLLTAETAGRLQNFTSGSQAGR